MAFTGKTINQSQNSTENNEMQKAIEIKQKEISDIKERFQVLMQESGVVFEIITPDGTIKYISETSEKVIKYKSEKLVGEKIYQFYEGEELMKLTAMVKYVAEAPENKIQKILTFKTKSKKDVHLEVSMQNLLNNPVIQGIVLNFRDVTQRMKIEKRMNHIATHDDLTGLPNRAYFKNELAVQCKLAKKNDALLAVMMLDFEGLKYINDALSFQSGGEMIIQMMIRLKVILGDENFISRYSEDQFAVILKNSINLGAYEAMAKSIIVLFSRAFKVDIYEFDVTINMGISVFSKDYQNGEEADFDKKDQFVELLIKHANMALLWSKREGKNQHKFYSPDISVINYKQFELRTDL